MLWDRLRLLLRKTGERQSVRRTLDVLGQMGAGSLDGRGDDGDGGGDARVSPCGNHQLRLVPLCGKNYLTGFH